MANLWKNRVNFMFLTSNEFFFVFYIFFFFIFIFAKGIDAKKGFFPSYKLLYLCIYTKYNIYLYKGSENLPEIKGKTVHDITNYIGKHVVPNIYVVYTHKWMLNYLFVYFFLLFLFFYFFYHIFLIHSTHFLNMKIALSNYDNKFYFNYKMAAKHQRNKLLLYWCVLCFK